MDPSEIPGIDIRKQGVFCPNEPHPGLPRIRATGRGERVRVDELRSVVCATVKMMKAHIQCGVHTPRTGTRISLRLTRGDSRLLSQTLAQTQSDKVDPYLP
jgi:hypothetical protein